MSEPGVESVRATEAPLAERRARLLELLDQVDKQSPLVLAASAAFWVAVERHRQAQHSDDADLSFATLTAHVDECRTRAAREDAKMTQLLDRLRAEHCAVKWPSTTRRCRICSGEPIAPWPSAVGKGPTHHTCHPGEERIAASVPRSAAWTLSRSEFTVGAVGGGFNEAADSTILLAAGIRAVSPLPNDVPDSGVLRIFAPDDSGDYLRFVYAAVDRTLNTFDLQQGIGQDTIGDVTGALALTATDNAHVVFIEQDDSDVPERFI